MLKISREHLLILIFVFFIVVFIFSSVNASLTEESWEGEVTPTISNYLPAVIKPENTPNSTIPTRTPTPAP